MLIFDRQSPLLRSLQGNQLNRLGAFYNLQFCDQQTCSQDRKPHTVSLPNHPALVSAVGRPAIDLPSQDTTPTKNEEISRDKKDIPNISVALSPAVE